MTIRTKTILKTATAGGLLLAAVAFGISRLQHLTNTGEEGQRVWFYDQSQRRLYAVPRDTLPPHVGIGGDKGDGVRAVVVAASIEKDDLSKRRIAYLETYTPALKKLLEGIRAARAAGRAYEGTVPDGDTEFIHENTLVRCIDDPQWYAMTTAEARRIMSEWRTWRGPDGLPLVVCTP